VKKDVAAGSPPKKKGRITPKKKGRGKAEPKKLAKKATEPKGKAAPNEPAKSVWTYAHSKFQMGKPVMSTEVLVSAGVNTRALYEHYVTHAMNHNDDNSSIVGQFKAHN